jgi:hypothetical protein
MKFSDIVVIGANRAVPGALGARDDEVGLPRR